MRSLQKVETAIINNISRVQLKLMLSLHPQSLLGKACSLRTSVKSKMTQAKTKVSKEITITSRTN